MKGILPFKMHKIIFFFRKKKLIKKNCMCLPYLKFPDLLPKTSLFFIWPYMAQCVWSIFKMKNKNKVPLLKFIIVLRVNNNYMPFDKAFRQGEQQLIIIYT